MFMKLSKIARATLSLSGVLLSSYVLWGRVAKADVSISPVVIETEVQRGQAQGTISVANKEAETFRARVYTTPFTYDREQGFQALSSSTNDLSPYLQFSPKELVVSGLDTRRVRFIVRFPPSLPDGEYRTMVFTERLQAANITQTDKENGVTLITGVIPRIGVAVYARKGNITPKLIADSARFNPQLNQVQFLIRNTGKASAIVKGDWTIKQAGKEIKKGTILDTTIIAEGERYLLTDPRSQNQPKLAQGNYQLSGELRWGENKLPFNLNLTVPGN